MAGKTKDTIVMLRVVTEEGLMKLKNGAQACREQSRLHNPSSAARIYHAIAQGLEMVAVSSPEEIADVTIQVAITTSTGRTRLTQTEQNHAMKLIRKRVQELQSEERRIITRGKRDRDYRMLPRPRVLA